MSAAGRWLSFIAILLALLIPIAPASTRAAARSAALAPASLQEALFNLVSPANCPASGCAPGQRLNLRFEFGLVSYDPAITGSNNVKVCVYAPNDWVQAGSVSTDANGGVTGLPYTPTDACSEDTAPPAGYQLIAARTALVNLPAFGDTLGVSLRLANSAAAPGKLLARLFERNASGWARTEQGSTATIEVAALSSPAYAAAVPSTCDAGPYTPCYVNSADDLPGGLGTGLKDAADAVADGATIYLAGSYPIKSSAVLVNRPVVIAGMPGSNLTYTGSACGSAMLTLAAGVTVRDLDINDGPNCTATNRPLIEVNSTAGVLIESNRLRGGDRGVWIRDNTGSVSIRYNQIEGNSGHAIFWDEGPGTAPMDVVANNFSGNGAAIFCGGTGGVLAYREANHNYWGSPNLPGGISESRCSITAGKQLGAPVLPRVNRPGLQAQRVTVTENKTYAPGLDNQIAYQRTGGDGNFDLYIVNHGYGSEAYLPFTLSKSAGPSPCSNYFDVFLADGAAPNGTLELFLKYNKTNACIAAINSNQFCEQTSDQARYPLWWYDPSAYPNNNITEYWNTTGQRPNGPNASNANGQSTTCHPANNEVQVSIDNDGRPSLLADLSHVPLVTGIQIIRTFEAASSSNIVTINWATNNEPDINGFYVLRSLDGANFNPITDLIARRGQALLGSTYQYIDSGRVSGSTYYYQLKIMRNDGTAIYSNISEVTVVSSTATITRTPGPTATLTRTPGPSPTLPLPTNTRTLTPTLVPTRAPTRIPTWTPTAPFPTPTRPVLTLITRTPTLWASGTITPEGGQPFTTGTPIAQLETPGPGGYPEPGEGGYPEPGGGYPGPDATSPGAPTTQGTARLTPSMVTPTAPVGAISPRSISTNPTLLTLRNLLTGYSIGMALLGAAAAWFFYGRSKGK